MTRILTPGEESWYAMHMRHIVLNTRRREGAAGVKMKAIGFRLPAGSGLMLFDSSAETALR